MILRMVESSQGARRRWRDLERAEGQVRLEYSRRLAIAIEAERNQADAQARAPDIAGMRAQVLAELGLSEADVAAMFATL